jgi:transcriptional regulator with XRE-family HTH domain
VGGVVTKGRSAGSGTSFGKRIQELRRAASFTQRDVAKKVGIDFTYLSKLENDRGEAPGEETIRKLASLLKGDVEELLALAGKIPAELRSMAQSDQQFAVFLRRLPQLSDEQLRGLYRKAGVKPPSK